MATHQIVEDSLLPNPPASKGDLKCEATLERIVGSKAYTLLRIVSESLLDLIEALKEHTMVDDYVKDLNRIKSEDLQLVRLFKDMKAIQIDANTGQVTNGEVLTIQISRTVAKGRRM